MFLQSFSKFSTKQLKTLLRLLNRIKHINTCWWYISNWNKSIEQLVYRDCKTSTKGISCSKHWLILHDFNYELGRKFILIFFVRVFGSIKRILKRWAENIGDRKTDCFTLLSPFWSEAFLISFFCVWKRQLWFISRKIMSTVRPG